MVRFYWHIRLIVLANKVNVCLLLKKSGETTPLGQVGCMLDTMDLGGFLVLNLIHFYSYFTVITCRKPKGSNMTVY